MQVRTKTPITESFFNKTDKHIISCSKVFIFLRASGLSVNGTLVEKDTLELVSKLKEAVGDVKVTRRPHVAKSMFTEADKLIIGGSSVCTFLKGWDLSVDDAFMEKDALELAKKLEARTHSRSVRVRALSAGSSPRP